MTHPLTGHPDDCACDRCGQPAPTYLAIAMENRDLRERLESAEANERARIVAWLRREAAAAGTGIGAMAADPYPQQTYYDEAADEIERLAHLAGDAEKKEKKT